MAPRSPLLPSMQVAILGGLVAGIGGVVAVLLAAVADDAGLRWGMGVAGLLALSAAYGLFAGKAWGALVFAVIGFPAALSASRAGPVAVVAGVAAAVLSLAVAWGALGVGWRKVRGLPPAEPDGRADVPEPTRFVPHDAVMGWVVLAVVAVLLSIVLPRLLR